MRYVIDRETQLHGFWGIDVSYLSDICFEQLSAGDTTECRLGMILFTCCIVELDYYVTFLSPCFILIVANYIRHMGRTIISWIWGVCDVTMT